MTFYNNKWCVTGAELVLSDENPNGIISQANFAAWIYRKKLTNLLGSACFGKPALYALDQLDEKYYSLWIAKNGKPEERGDSNLFFDKYRHDEKAAVFFAEHIVEYGEGLNDKKLTPETQLLYTYNASVLNAIRAALETSSRERRSKQGNQIKSSDFWRIAAKVSGRFISEKGIKHNLPQEPRRLKDKYDRYIKEGYGSLIHGNFQNKNTVKITKEVGEWLVAQWMSMFNRCTIEQLHARYNEEAYERNDPKNWKFIKSSNAIRAYLFRPDIEEKWHAERYGELSYKEKFTRQNRTVLPTVRDALWYSDGTKLNYYYRDAKGEMKTCNVYEVVDVYSESLLGYCISKAEDYEAQYASYKMAIQTSGQKPYEIRFDNQGGHGKLDNGGFLAGIARHAIRTAPYNGKSKTIENIFYRFQKDYLHQDWFFTGQNITAKKKESGVNMEKILANKKNLPTLEGIKKAYAQRRNEWNNAPHFATGIPRIEMYRNSINEKAQKVGIIDMIDMFGITTPDTRQYLASGIELEIKGKKHPFEVLTADGQPDYDFNRRNIGRKFYRRYCPDDLSVISLYEKSGDNMRFVAIAKPYLKVHRALQDQDEVDVSIIRHAQQASKEQRIDNAVRASDLLEKYGLHPEQHGLAPSVIKGVTTGKHRKTDIGQYLKDQSMIDRAEVEEGKDIYDRKTQQQAQKDYEMECEIKERREDNYLKRKRELLEF